MDSGTLRLILAVAGILLLAGIYYFGKKKQNAGKPQAKTFQDEIAAVEEQEPWITSEEPDLPLNQELEQLDERVAESDLTLEAEVESEANLESFDIDAQQELFADEQDEMSVAAESDLPQKILQIMVVSHGEPFSGESIQQITEECGLKHGDMQIYHHYDPHSKKPLFSMASMVEPGNFPTEMMAELTTPGLALFAQLPAAKPGLEIYDEMVSTADKLAKKLDGELLDATHSVLSKQTIEHTRGEILEYQRQVQLASKRR